MTATPTDEDAIINRAMEILETRARYLADRTEFKNPADVRTFLNLRLSELQHEQFWTCWLDARNRLIAAECMFTGTLTQTSVYPREVVRRALHHNAASVILAHNHPSGNPQPSPDDKTLTRHLVDALALIDVRVLDHFIIGRGQTPTSFAEWGLL